MSLNRGQIFKPLGYQSVYSANKIPITNDPLVKLTLLIVNYSREESKKIYQHQLDTLFTNVFGLFEELEIDVHYQQSILKMYIDTFITNVESLTVNEKARYHFELLLKEISNIPNKIDSKLKKKCVEDWIEKKNSIDSLERISPFEEDSLTLQLIQQPIKLENNHSLINLLYSLSIIITIVGIIILLVAVFTNRT